MKWSPSEFWAATPADIRLAVRGLNDAAEGNSPYMGRDELEDLMNAYPDEDHGSSHTG